MIDAAEAPIAKPSNAGRIAALDGVRGLCTIAVIAAHSIYFGGLGDLFWRGRSSASLSQLDWQAAGWLWTMRDTALPGMDVFFVLSSFLITGILCDSRGARGYFSSFYARRTLRIFPLYYLALAILLIATWWAQPDAPILRDQLWFWSYLSNHLLAQGWSRAPEQFHHYWSLAVEEQFYLVWPVVVFLCGRRQLKLVCGAAFVGALAFRLSRYASGDGASVYVSTFGRIDQLAVGAYLALHARDSGGLDKLGRAARPITALSFAAIVAMAIWRGGMSEPDIIVGTIGHTIYAVFAGALLCYLVTARSRLERFFQRPALRACGKYSYALYIFHQPILILLSVRWGLDLWRLPRFTGFVIAGQLAVALLAFAVTLCVSLASWHLIETPFLKLRARFPRAR